LPLVPRANLQHRIPRHRPILRPRLHMVTSQPRHTAQLPRTTGVQGAVAAVGADGFQLRRAWHHPQG
jgi:hypothetical protein